MSWTIGRLFGIPVRLHFTMVLVPFLTYNWTAQWEAELGAFANLLWAGLVVLLFGSVLLHELGHALTARKFGIHTQDIVLTPIGGIARVTRMPKNPKQEIAIAAAGPIVSFLLALFAFGLIHVLPPLDLMPAILVNSVMLLNAGLALFNLVPALPMDGGRVLRGILALKRDHLTATRIAAKIGRALAVLGLLVGLFADEHVNVNLALISVFIYIAAGSEVRMAEFRAAQERSYSEGRSPFGFPFGPSGVHTWTWRTGRPAVRREDFETPVEGPRNDDWVQSTERTNRDVVVVSGRAEIVGRRDPEK